MAEGLVVIDNERRVILMNQAAGILLRMSPVEAVGKPILRVMSFLKDGREPPVIELPHEQAIRDKNIITITLLDNLSARNRQGQIFPVSIMAAPLLQSGEVNGAILLLRDVTREKEVDRAKTEFVSLASHQLKTPLAAVGWYAEALLNEEVGPLNDKQKEYVRNLHESNQRMVELVNALLNVSRLELGTFIVEPAPTNASALVESVIGELRPSLLTKQIEIKTTYDQSLPPVNLDPKLTRIIIQNLLSNAIKYTPMRGEVTVALTRADDQLLIRVGDSGYGIPAAAHDKIFSKLFRADNVRDKEADGTGLGLYLVKSIVEHTGGRIWFDSLEGKGTTFYVTVPLTGMIKKEGTRRLT